MNKKNILNIIFIFLIIIISSYIIFLNIPNILGYKSLYTGYSERHPYNGYKISRSLVLYDPISNKNIGFINKGFVINDPSFTDAIDLGDSMTYKICLKLDQSLIKKIDYKQKGFYREVLIDKQ